VPPERLYTDYKAMLAAEQPDIVSVVTQPEHRAEILIYAAAQPCVRALFSEKAFASSLAEAQAVVEACKEHGVIVNMGTLRRYDAGYDAAQRLVHSGELGQLKTIIAHSTSSLFNGSSHTFDAVNWLNKDAKPVSIMGELTADPTVEMADGTTKPLLDQDEAGNNVLRADPLGHGIVEYDNGVTAYMLNSGRGTEFEAICERGHIKSLNNGETWTLREPRGQVLDRLDGKSSAALANAEERNSKLAAGDRNQTKVVQGQWDFSPDLTFETKSSTVVSVREIFRFS